MSAMASQITKLTENIKAPRLVWGIHRHKGPVMRKMFPFDDVIMVVSPGCFRSIITPSHKWLARHVLFVKSTETELQQGPLRRDPCASFLNLCHYIHWVLTFIAWWWPDDRGPQAINSHSDNSKLSLPSIANPINQNQTVYSTASAHLSCAFLDWSCCKALVVKSDVHVLYNHIIRDDNLALGETSI